MLERRASEIDCHEKKKSGCKKYSAAHQRRARTLCIVPRAVCTTGREAAVAAALETNEKAAGRHLLCRFLRTTKHGAPRVDVSKPD